MPGENPSAALLPSQIALQQSLQQFVAVSQSIAQAQLELLSLMREYFQKPPSVFKSGSFNDAIASYNLIQSGTMGAFYKGPTVKVIDLYYASKVKISTFQAAVFGAANSGTFFLKLFCALDPSPTNQFSQIPADQFFALRQSEYNSVANGSNSVVTPSTNIMSGNAECSDVLDVSGNRFLHVFGLYNGPISAQGSTILVDYFGAGDDDRTELPANCSTYALIK